MRRLNIASPGRSESPIESQKCSTRTVQDFHALRSSKRYDICSLKVFLTVVLGALVVVILWTRHGSQKLEKQSFVFPVYATSLNVTWRDDVPFNNNPSRSSLRRSLMAGNYISEVRPVLRHIVYQIDIEVRGSSYYMALDTGSWASWLFCNYYPQADAGFEDTFYTPAPDNFVHPRTYVDEFAKSMGGSSNRYITFRKCGPGLKHVCCELHFIAWGRLILALVEDAFLILRSRDSSKNKAAPENLKFGCAFKISTNIVPATYGLMGLGNMSISIPNQMAEKGLIQHVIGFCFQYGVYQVDHKGSRANVDPIGYFILGKPFDYEHGYQWIPMGAKPYKHMHDLIYFHSIQMDSYNYDVTKHDITHGATMVDTGNAYMILIPPLYHSIFKIVSACATRHGYVQSQDHTYGTNSYIWTSPFLDSYFSIYNHFEDLRMVFYTEEKGKNRRKTKKNKQTEIEDEETTIEKERENALEMADEYIFKISPFGYLQIIDILDIPFENKILHQYVIAFAIHKDIPADGEISVNLIGGIALRGNKLIMDHAKQRVGLKPEYKCAL